MKALNLVTLLGSLSMLSSYADGLGGPYSFYLDYSFLADLFRSFGLLNDCLNSYSSLAVTFFLRNITLTAILILLLLSSYSLRANSYFSCSLCVLSRCLTDLAGELELFLFLR